MHYCRWFGFMVLLLALSGNSACAQSSASSQTAIPELTILQHTLWRGVPVHRVDLRGMGTWHAGSEVEQGGITLSATSAGVSSLDFSPGDGSHKLTATAIGPGRECTWSKDGTSHQEGYLNCLKPLVWFLPGITLQPDTMPSSIGIDNMGTVQLNGHSFHALKAQVVKSGLSASLLKEATKRSTMTLDLNPRTSLPAQLHYSVHPNNGAPTNIRIEIRYSDYHKVDNAEIPYHIQRFVNGSLQLDIEISSASLS